jgi:hypothetical protein
MLLAVFLQNTATTLEISFLVSYKAKHNLPYNPTIPLLAIYTKEMEIYVITKPIYEHKKQL